MFQELICNTLESHSDSIQTTLHNHLLEVDFKVSASRNINSQGSNYATDNLKLIVPRFDGTKVMDWIFQIEAFFNFHDTLVDSRLQIVSFHMDGCAAG
jgi:hypothetical protein